MVPFLFYESDFISVLFQELGVFGTFSNVDEYCLDLIPVDCDLLSMEMEQSFKVYFCSLYLLMSKLTYTRILGSDTCI